VLHPGPRHSGATCRNNRARLPHLIFLDVEKSGPTFVSQFCRDFLDDEVDFAKHVPLLERVSLRA
jgi:hypothetical protein